MHKILSSAVLMTSVVVVAIGTAAAQTSKPRAGGIPTFEVDHSWPKVPAKWKLGDESSMAIDAKDNVWVLHRPRTLKPEQAAMAAPPVIVFDTAGNYIKAWGGAGSGFEWPEREHGIHIDSKGFVWIGGNSCPTNGLPGLKPVADDQLLKFTQDGKFVMQIGHSNQSKGNADTANLHRPADEQVYAPTNSLLVANDGIVYVADRENRRVQMFTNDGKFIKQLIKPDTLFARSVAFSPDQEQQFLYVGDGEAVAILDRKTLEVLASIKVPGMQGGGHLINTDAKGNIYIANTGKGMQKLAFKGMSAATAAK